MAPSVQLVHAAKISVGYDLYGGGGLESTRTTKLNSSVELGILWISTERGRPRGHDSGHCDCQICWYFASPSEIVLYDRKAKWIFGSKSCS